MRARSIIIYVLLVVALLTQPHVFQGHVGLLSSATAQSFTTFAILLLAGATYILHRSDVRREEHKKRQSNRKLMASFRYIGVVNRHLPLLEGLTTELLRTPLATRAGQKEAFQMLLSAAVVSVAHAAWGTIRIVDRMTGRTVAEHTFLRHGAVASGVPPGNRELFEREAGGPPSAQDGLTVLWSTDAEAPVQCFLVLPPVSHQGRNIPILQAIVDQAQLLQSYRAGSQTPARTTVA